MDDAAAMGVVERLGRLTESSQRILAADLADAHRVGDGSAGQALHDDERASGLAGLARLGLADVEDRDHIRVAREVGRGARLALEAVDRGRVVEKLLGEQLDRHRAPQHDVLGAPDRGHAAAGDAAQDRVPLRQPDV